MWLHSSVGSIAQVSRRSRFSNKRLPWFIGVSQFSSTDQHVVLFFDVGNIVSGNVDPRTLQSHEKIKHLKNHFTPPPSHTGFFSKTVVKGKDKDTKMFVFQPSWLDKYTWLVCSPSQMGGFCKYCAMHNSPSVPRAQKRPLVTAPFQKLEKATVKDGVLERHQKIQCHQLALEAGIAIIRSVQKPKETLPYRTSTQNQEMFEKNMNALRAIICTIILCGKQNIPLSSVGRASVCCAGGRGSSGSRVEREVEGRAGGRGFEPQTGPTLRVLK